MGSCQFREEARQQKMKQQQKLYMWVKGSGIEMSGKVVVATGFEARGNIRNRGPVSETEKLGKAMALMISNTC